MHRDWKHNGFTPLLSDCRSSTCKICRVCWCINMIEGQPNLFKATLTLCYTITTYHRLLKETRVWYAIQSTCFLLAAASSSCFVNRELNQRLNQLKSSANQGKNSRHDGENLKSWFSSQIHKISLRLLPFSSRFLLVTSSDVVLHFVLHKSQGCGPHGTSRINKHAFERPIETWCTWHWTAKPSFLLLPLPATSLHATKTFQWQIVSQAIQA